MLTLPELSAIFESHGGTDRAYLAFHYRRFVSTLREFDSTWDRQRGRRVLDLGAHWLHNALLWKHAGYEVTAVDLPGTLQSPAVQRVAEAEGIRLVAQQDLEGCPELARLPEGSFDVVVFAEIIEHITFNPVHLWKQIHRLLAPGGRIVVTTPNYYAWSGRAWRWWRFLGGQGGGITVDQILKINTYGHHWREFSKGELVRYFRMLSPDFRVVKARTAPSYDRAPVVRRLVDVLPLLPLSAATAFVRLVEGIPFLRPQLHLEVELAVKDRGIVVEPSW